MKLRALLLLSSLFGFYKAQAEHQEFLSGKYELIEYYFTDVLGGSSAVHCTEDEIVDGLVNNIFTNADDKAHSLEPSYQPSHGRGAWSVSQNSCQSQKPFYNGIGFEDIDKTTGDAAVYIAGFQRKPAKNKPGIGGFASDIYRGHEIVNMDRFRANCQFEQGVASYIPMFGSKTLVCVLENDRGFIKFRKK